MKHTFNCNPDHPGLSTHHTCIKNDLHNGNTTKTTVVDDTHIYHIWERERDKHQMVFFISYLGMKSWDLHVCDRASTITHVDRVKKSNPWFNKIWLCLNVSIWSSQICFSVIFIHFVMIQNIWEKKLHLFTLFQSPVTASAYFWSTLKAC